MSTLSLADGTTFNGRYRVVRCMAHGGMGAVYEVIHLETERRRALKVMLPHLVQSAELRDRFRQEARVAARIESAYIVEVFDAGIDEQTGMPFLVMELLKGEELGKRLERLKRLPPTDVVKYLRQTASALDKTHKANIVHRDLKPENLFLHEQDDDEPRIKVLDFGIAKIVAENGTQANATRSVGTPLYMAPEQFKPGSQVFPATDIYALGLVAYTLLVGGPYWEDEQRANDNVFAFVASVMHGPKEPATARAGRRGVKLPAAFDAWFAKVTNASPEQRYPSAPAAIAGLAEALGLQPPEASRTINKTELLGEEGSRIQTVKLMPDIRGALKSGGPSVTPAPAGIAVSNAAPAPRAPLGSAVGTEQLAPAVMTPQLGSPQAAPPSMPIAGAAQTGPSGVTGIAITQPQPTQPQRSKPAAGVAIVGVLGLLVAAIGIAFFISGKTETKPTSAGSAPMAPVAAPSLSFVEPTRTAAPSASMSAFASPHETAPKGSSEAGRSIPPSASSIAIPKAPTGAPTPKTPPLRTNPREGL